MGLKIVTTAKKGLSLIGTSISAVADTIEGTLDIGVKAKKSLDGEIETLQNERNIENASSRIIARHNHTQLISEKLGISYEEAANLLSKEISE